VRSNNAALPRSQREGGGKGGVLYQRIRECTLRREKGLEFCYMFDTTMLLFFDLSEPAQFIFSMLN
jgi:hypothetical protein